MTAAVRLSQLGQRPEVPVGRVVCFHHAGGSAAEFRSWPAGLGDSIVLQAAGPRRSDPHESIPRLAASVADQLANAVCDATEPIVLFGLSFGGLCAFEVARHLEQTELQNPVHLVIASARPPGSGLGITADSSSHSDADLRRFLRSLGGTPRVHMEHADLLEAMLPLLRTDLRLIDEYRSHQPQSVRCPINYLGGAEDRRVPWETVRGWQGLTRSSFQAEFFAGGHFFLRDHQRAVVSRVRTIVEQLRG